MGETEFLTATGFRGPRGSLKTDYYFFGQLLQSEGWGRGRVRFHTPFLFLPRPLPPSRSLPPQLRAAGGVRPQPRALRLSVGPSVFRKA